MRILSTRIRNFRSIDHLELEFDRLTTICGPNSSGKSNVLKAILYALDPQVQEVHRNLPAYRRNSTGRLSIEVELLLTDCVDAVLQAAGADPGENVRFQFRITRSGNITTVLNGKPVPHRFLQEHLEIIYVPPIRDLAADGMKPFRALLGAALRRSRTATNLTAASERARAVLRDKAGAILGEQRAFVQNILRADTLELDTSGVTLEGLYENVSLNVQANGQTYSLADFGTGHQSALIINLFRQLGHATPGAKVFLFEEPDNHLHPSTIRALGDDLTAIAEGGQVITTTHSPILIAHLGLRTVRVLRSDRGLTRRRNVDLAGLSDAQIRAKLTHFGLRATEPLLSRRVIVCEGPSDVTVLSELARLRFGRTPEQMDVTMIAGGSKYSVAVLCQFLRQLDTDWRAVLDRDAAVSPELPVTRAGVSPTAVATVTAAINEVMQVLDPGTKRGKKALQSLQSIQAELANGRPLSTQYDRSELQTLLSGHIGTPAEVQIRTALDRGRRGYQAYLMSHSVWLWSGDLEEMLIPDGHAAATAEEELITLGVLRAPSPAVGREARIRSMLHNRGEDAEVLRAVACRLHTEGTFRRSQMAEALNYLFGGL